MTPPPAYPAWWLRALEMMAAVWRDCHLLADAQANAAYFAHASRYPHADVFGAIERLATTAERMPSLAALLRATREIGAERRRAEERARLRLPATPPTRAAAALREGLRLWRAEKLEEVRAAARLQGWDACRQAAAAAAVDDRGRALFGAWEDLAGEPVDAPPAPKKGEDIMAKDAPSLPGSTPHHIIGGDRSVTESGRKVGPDLKAEHLRL